MTGSPMKPLSKELIWLAAITLLTFIAVGVLLGDGIDIQLYDTYFVVEPEGVWYTVFLNLAFWIYLARQIVTRFGSQIRNIVLALVAALLIYNTARVTALLGPVATGWTVYPPLSAYPDGVLPEPAFTNNDLIWYFQRYQLFQIGVLGVAAYLAGRRAHSDAAPGEVVE